MMKNLFFLLAIAVCPAISQPVYVATGGSCSFHSSTPVEDIDAVSGSLNSVLNTANGEVQFKVPMNSFHFEKALMQEHFNEKYVESDKFPYATFRGKVSPMPEMGTDSTYDVTAEGVLNVHGVDKIYKETGKLTVKNREITIDAAFKVALKDHNIEIPRIVMANISEVIDVQLSCSYHPYKKK